jgi:hypothetical protein
MITETTVEQPVAQPKTHDRGVVGEGTAGKRLKALHAKEKSRLSLKRFLRSLPTDHAATSDIQKWFSSKRGKLSTKRSDNNIALARTIASATKAGRRTVKKS